MAAPALQQYQQGQGSVSADNLNTFEQTCDTVAQLRGFTGAAGMQVYLRGLAAPDDGGQGPFYWNATSTTTDDGVNVIAPGGASATTAGRWIRMPAALAMKATVATLPNPPYAGMYAYVTDGQPALTWGATATGGATTPYLVWYNGTNWTVVGK